MLPLVLLAHFNGGAEVVNRPLVSESLARRRRRRAPSGAPRPSSGAGRRLLGQMQGMRSPLVIAGGVWWSEGAGGASQSVSVFISWSSSNAFKAVMNMYNCTWATGHTMDRPSWWLCSDRRAGTNYFLCFPLRTFTETQIYFVIKVSLQDEIKFKIICRLLLQLQCCNLTNFMKWGNRILPTFLSSSGKKTKTSRSIASFHFFFKILTTFIAR